MTVKSLAQMADEVYAVNVANGWFEDDRTVGEDIALLHSEVSEMLEAYRDHGLADYTAERGKPIYEDGEDAMGYYRNLVGYGPPKPEGFGSEAADVLIRLLDTAKRRGIDLEWEFERKLAYNATRGHKHGGKRL